MTAKIQASATELLNENFNAELLHPADIEQILTAGLDVYEGLPKYSEGRREYRKKYNKLIDTLTQKRGFRQFNYIR